MGNIFEKIRTLGTDKAVLSGLFELVYVMFYAFNFYFKILQDLPKRLKGLTKAPSLDNIIRYLVKQYKRFRRAYLNFMS